MKWSRISDNMVWAVGLSARYMPVDDADGIVDEMAYDIVRLDGKKEWHLMKYNARINSKTGEVPDLIGPFRLLVDAKRVAEMMYHTGA